jgi:esterase/lipase superfamily enzyme
VAGRGKVPRRPPNGRLRALGTGLAAALLLAACGGPPELVFAPEAAAQATETVLVASIRAPEPPPVLYGNRQGADLSFARLEITVPPRHRPGMAAPAPRRPGDPDRHFLVASASRISTSDPSSRR